MTNGPVASILAVDCGSTATKAILLEVVDGRYRFVAQSQVPSTGNAPWRDITIGVHQAVRQMTEITGRPILSDDGQLIMPERRGGQGIDMLVATVSASPPLRVAIAGLSKSVSLASARRAARATYCRLVEQIALDESSRRSDAQRLQAVQSARPDVILLVGGTDGGAAKPVVDMARLMALAVQLEAERPPMIYAGNTELRSQIAGLLGEQVEFQAVDNVRPTLAEENLGPLQIELEQIFRQSIMPRLPGLDLLKQWSAGDVVPAAHGLGYVIRYLDQLDDKPRYGVLGIDIGSTSTTIAAARNGRFSLTVMTELGMGASIGQLLRQTSVEKITRWLPQDVPPEQVQHLVMNKELRPWTVPQTEQDLLIEQAAAREVISLALAEARGGWPLRERRGSPVLNEIVGSGGILRHAPTPGHAALMLLDAVQPAFWTSRLVLDKTGALPTLGALATVQPVAAAQMLEQGGLIELGSVISPVGVARYGAPVLSFKVKSALGTYEGDVKFGTLERIIVPLGTQAVLELRPTRRFDLGMGPGKGVKVVAWGGAVGIIIDARGRPLVWPEKKEARQEYLRRWLQELGAWSSELPDIVDLLGDL